MECIHRMLNAIWLFLILAGFAFAAFNGTAAQATDGAINASKTAVELSIGLVGLMALWLGLMRLADKSGLVQILARFLSAPLRWLFPDVPGNHPAMGSMLMNIAANMLGLANAATPLGLKAMKDLETLNPRPGTATNAMCTFLAINTSSVQLLPASVIAMLAAAGSAHPTAIVSTALLATLCSTAVGITSVKFLEKLPWFGLPQGPTPSAGPSESDAPTPSDAAAAPSSDQPEPAIPPLSAFQVTILALFFGTCAWLVYQAAAFPVGDQQDLSLWIRTLNALSVAAIPILVAFFPLYAALRKVPVYEQFVEGAKEGFDTAIRIIPYLVAMLVAIGLFRGAGGIDLLQEKLRPFLSAIGFPVELLPLTLMRPLSGSGSLGIFADLVKTFGADSLIARTAATILGSTETTFYVITVYFGSVAIRKTRHAIAAGLLADLAGVIAAIAICRVVFA